MRKSSFIGLLVLLVIPVACTKPKNTDREVVVNQPRLPYMGEFYTQQKEVNGTTVIDTVYQKIPSFSFINQDGKTTTDKDFDGKVYLADFFFTTCPSICPKMSNTLELVQQKMKGAKDFAILSHTIDPDYDKVEVLKEYAAKNHADPSVWTFVTGDRDSIYRICEESYMSFAKEDELAPGGYVHSGFLILIDKDKHIRGAYDGTRPELADEIANDIRTLLKEN